MNNLKNPQVSDSGFEIAHRRAKILEVRLEQRVQAYSTHCARLDEANYSVKDIEGGLRVGIEEQTLARDVEMDLNEMTECIDAMRAQCSGHNQQEVFKRFHEVHFDYSSEYRKSSSLINNKRQRAELFGTSNGEQSVIGSASSGEDSAVNRLLRERSGIANSMRSVNEVIAQAFDAKGHLLGQRSMLGSTTLSLTGLARSVPGFGKLVDGLSKKKFRENAIVAAFCGVLCFFTFWWTFLR